MKTNTLFITAFITLTLLTFVWSGCKKNNGPATEDFIIQIDSIVHADTITVGDVLNIKFYGTIGLTKCYAFNKLAPEYIQTGSTTGELSVTAWGIHTFDDICDSTTVYMNGNKLIVSDIHAGNLVIKAMQPDGTAITQNVFIKN